MKKSTRFIGILILLGSAMTTCMVYAQEKIPSKENSAYSRVADVAYKDTSSAYERERGTLDLYLPKDKEHFPILIWFYGGTLKYGDKNVASATSVGKRFAAEGIGVVIPNYRLSPQVKYPMYIEDAASSFAWVYHNIKQYNGNPGLIFIGGHSSGAYLSAMISLNTKYLMAHQLSTERIAGVILNSGQMFKHSTVLEERGILTPYKIVDESAPLFHVRADAPPILCMCADGDGILADNKIFINSLQKAGHIHNQFIEVAHRDHMSMVTQIENPNDEVAHQILTFIREISANRPAR